MILLNLVLAVTMFFLGSENEYYESIDYVVHIINYVIYGLIITQVVIRWV